MIPREAISAGFDEVGTCFQFTGGILSVSSTTLLATNVFKRVGGVQIQPKAMVESLQANTSAMLMESSAMTVCRSFDSRTADDNSSLGIVMGLTGATRDCDHKGHGNSGVSVKCSNIYNCSDGQL